jgi:hypothetical protein
MVPNRPTYGIYRVPKFSCKAGDGENGIAGHWDISAILAGMGAKIPGYVHPAHQRIVRIVNNAKNRNRMQAPALRMVSNGNVIIALRGSVRDSRLDLKRDTEVADNAIRGHVNLDVLPEIVSGIDFLKLAPVVHEKRACRIHAVVSRNLLVCRSHREI